MYRMHRGNDDRRPNNVARVMVGLRWAPETGPAAKMNKGRTRIVVSAPIKLGTSALVAKMLHSVIIKILANKKLGRTYSTV